MASNIEYFSHSQGVLAKALNFNVTNISSPSGFNPLEKLEAHIAPEALHDSAERCDAPKCHPETRVAVQDDLYSWIEHEDANSPTNMKWVTGPAGTGKTAVMGSVTKRCKQNGFPVASFFFSSTGSIGRRTKTAFVTTIAHQLAQHRQDLKDAIAAAIETDTIVFKKNLQVQMETLVLAPLRAVAGASNATFRGVIIIDGLDECGVERIHEDTTRTNEQDQLEILRVLRQASSDPTFPFRILIASRPERVFREFFDPENNPTPFADKLDLHEQYNADADINLFLEVQFSRIRRRYNLPPSWLPPDAIKTLVDRASGQFIYAATVIRFLETGHREPPKALLEAILKVKATTTANPLKHLDELYLHILNSSPDPPLSVRWIRSIDELSHYTSASSAFNMNLLLQTDPESNEADHLLGNLYSLVQIPPPSDQPTIKYGFYHKTLLDFLKHPDRCGKLYFEKHEIELFFWDGFVRACARGCDTQFSYPENFLRLLLLLPRVSTLARCGARSEVLPTPASANWWVSLAIVWKSDQPVLEMFEGVHRSCRYSCNPACIIWSRSILDHLGASGMRRIGISEDKRFLDLANKAERDADRRQIYGSVKEAGKGSKKRLRASGAAGAAGTSTAIESSATSSSSLTTPVIQGSPSNAVQRSPRNGISNNVNGMGQKKVNNKPQSSGPSQDPHPLPLSQPPQQQTPHRPPLPYMRSQPGGHIPPILPPHLPSQAQNPIMFVQGQAQGGPMMVPPALSPRMPNFGPIPNYPFNNPNLPSHGPGGPLQQSGMPRGFPGAPAFDLSFNRGPPLGVNLSLNDIPSSAPVHRAPVPIGTSLVIGSAAPGSVWGASPSGSRTIGSGIIGANSPWGPPGPTFAAPGFGAPGWPSPSGSNGAHPRMPIQYSPPFLPQQQLHGAAGGPDGGVRPPPPLGGSSMWGTVPATNTTLDWSHPLPPPGDATDFFLPHYWQDTHQEQVDGRPKKRLRESGAVGTSTAAESSTQKRIRR